MRVGTAPTTAGSGRSRPRPTPCKTPGRPRTTAGELTPNFDLLRKRSFAIQPRQIASSQVQLCNVTRVDIHVTYSPVCGRSTTDQRRRSAATSGGHPAERMFQSMLGSEWRSQQLARGLSFGTIDTDVRERAVRRVHAHNNECTGLRSWPTNGSPTCGCTGGSATRLR